LISLGVYTDISLKLARERRDAVRQQLAAGIDPGQARKAQKFARAGAKSFEAIAREWHMKFSAGWVPSHSGRILRRLENDLFPWLGKGPVADITAPELLSVLRRMESRGAAPTGPSRIADRSSGTRWPRAGRSVIRPVIFAAPYLRPRSGTTPQSSSRSALVSCFVPSTPTKDSS
jgi:hypothetical protein